jgi:hypothetical protein
MLPDVHPLVEAAIWVAFALGGLLCLLNFSLPVRYYYRRWKKLPDERHVSPIPLIGSLFVFLTLHALDVVPVAKVIGWVLILIDVGGIHWFIFSMIYHALRAIFRWLFGPRSKFIWPSVNPMFVVVLVLLALTLLIKAYA